VDSLSLTARVATRAPQTRSLERTAHEALPKPEMNRQERFIFTAYMAMAALVTAFLVATAVAWWLG
jgi:hypothetical protein